MRRYRAAMNEENRISDDMIKKLIQMKSEENAELVRLQRYALGDNPGIMDKDVPDGKNQIPVSYGRLLVKIVVGFMYKSGLITYSQKEDYNQDAYLEQLQDVFSQNTEAQLNTELGKDQTIFGEAYELHYIDNDEGVDQFAKIPVYEFIPVYNYDIKPKLIAGIRFYREESVRDQVIQVEVYYADRVDTFLMRGGGGLESVSSFSHPYQQVPVVVYRNNEDRKGDIEHIAKLIDAYDIMVSTFLDDEEKFAEAILLLYGKYLDKETVEKLKNLRVIDNLKENDRLEYLTKDLSVSGRQELLDIIRQEIHRQSLIPDMTDTEVLGQKSGEAFIYLFALFELLAGEKQGYFTQGLRKRIELVTTVMGYPKGQQPGDPSGIKITFSRNLPKNLTMLSEVVAKLWGMASKKTLLGLLPFVENPDAELSQLEDEEDNELEGPRTREEILELYNQQQSRTHTA